VIPSVVDDTLAPPGRHVASLFCQHVHPDLPAVAPDRTWDDARAEVADLMIDTVNGFAPNFRASVLGRRALTPLDLEREFGLVGGDIFHGALSLDQLFSARPVLGNASYRAPLRGLYLCGAGTHPGGGVTGMTATLEAAAAGYPVTLVEKSGSLGGAEGKSYKRVPEHSPYADPEDTGVAEMIATSATLNSLNKVVEQRDFGANLARDIARADLRLKPSEFLMIWAGAVIGIPLVMLLLSPIIKPLGNPLFLLLGGFIGFLLPRFWLARRRNSRLGAFNKQLPDTITLIANALRAGSSFLQAIELVVRESRPPISTEFARVIREVNLGLPFDQALENMVRRVRSDDLELMATAISIQHQVGGNLAEILDSIAYTIRERVRIKGEIRTLTAQQRMSGYVVGFLPIGLAGFLFIAAPGFMEPMFANPPEILGLPAGVVILIFGGFMMFMGFMFIRRIVDIEV